MATLTRRSYPIYLANIHVALERAAHHHQIFAFEPLRAEDLEPADGSMLVAASPEPIVTVRVAMVSRLLLDRRTLIVGGHARPLDARRLMKLAVEGTPGFDLESPSAVLAEAATS